MAINVVSKERIEYGEDWLQIMEKKFSLSLDFSDWELDVICL